MVVGLGRRAHDHGQVAGLDVLDGGAHGVEAEAAVLHVDHDELSAGGAQGLADAWNGELENEGADLRRRGADRRP